MFIRSAHRVWSRYLDSCTEVSPAIIVSTTNVYVVVSGRNRTLLHYVFLVLEALQRSISIKGGTHVRYVDLSGIHASSLHI